MTVIDPRRNKLNYDVVEQSLGDEILVHDDRLYVSLLMLQPLLRCLCVPLADADFHIAIGDVEHAMGAGQYNRRVDQRTATKALCVLA